jgi:hypothetical protein
MFSDPWQCLRIAREPDFIKAGGSDPQYRSWKFEGPGLMPSHWQSQPSVLDGRSGAYRPSRILSVMSGARKALRSVRLMYRFVKSNFGCQAVKPSCDATCPDRSLSIQLFARATALISGCDASRGSLLIGGTTKRESQPAGLISSSRVRERPEQSLPEDERLSRREKLLGLSVLGAAQSRPYR